MAHYAIATDLNRCVACMACNAACKMVNNVPIGSFWNKVLRIGPSEGLEGGDKPGRDFYYLPVQCQHCKDPECVKVCPTEASHVLPDGTVQIDKAKCIGCQFCAMACPYGVRYLNEEERVVEKCTLCEAANRPRRPAAVREELRRHGEMVRRRRRRHPRLQGRARRDDRQLLRGVFRLRRASSA